MRLQPKPSKTPYLNRGDQFRLLAMCSMLFLVLWAFREAANPKTWAWIARSADETAEIDERDLRDISYLIHDETQHLKPDEFIGSVMAEAAPAATEDSLATAANLALDPKLFSPVKDQTIGWRSRDELKSLHFVLDQVRSLSAADMRAAARDDVGFRFLNQEPDKFRGQLIHLTGLLWQLEVFEEGDAELGIAPVYTGWMFTDDSGNKPWMVLLTELPVGLDLGAKLDRPVRVTGYFFKRFGYETAGDQLNVAPLLVAKTFELPPLPEVDRKRTNEATLYVVGALVFSLAFLGVIVLLYMRSDRQFAGSRLAELAKADVPQSLDPDLLKQIQTTDPSAAIQGLTTRDES